MSPTTTVRENFEPFAYLCHENGFGIGPAHVGVYGVSMLSGVGVWLLYWHQYQRNWVTLRSLDPVHAERMRHAETLIPLCVVRALEATMPPGMRSILDAGPLLPGPPGWTQLVEARDSGNSG